MLKKEALELARSVRDSIETFNNVYDEIGFDLYQFTMNNCKMNVFAYIRKDKDLDTNRKFYAVYAGVEYEGGDTLYADYNHSTDNLRVSELANALYELANLYKSEELINYVQELVKEAS